jgi:hypothetical protein
MATTITPGGGSPAWTDVAPVSSIPGITLTLDGLVLAAGFEDRAFGVLPQGRFRPDAVCILIRYQNTVVGNDTVFQRYLVTAREQFAEGNIHVLDLHQDRPARFERDLGELLTLLPRAARRFGLDISGLPSYAICMALKALRMHRAEDPLTVLYTAALEYNPSREEYDQLVAQSGDGDEIELIPHSMALEMDENLQLDSFSGYRSQNAKSCLAILSGYEVHRANGVVEAVNPSLLLLLYGRPGDNRLDWRLDLSRRLHRKFEHGRRTATEVVSTLRFDEALATLESYYNFLIDDYDLVLSPIGSKMHTLAAYLFWERFGEVQLMFPLPIGYDPSHRPTGVGTTYATILEPRRLLFRGSWALPSSGRDVDNSNG